MSSFDLNDEQKEEIFLIIFGENGKIEDSLIGSTNVDNFKKRFNSLNGQLAKYEHPKKQLRSGLYDSNFISKLEFRIHCQFRNWNS